MDNIVKKLSEIEQAADEIVSHAEGQKAIIEQEIQGKRNAFDEKLERNTKERLQVIRDDMEKQMAVILEKQEQKNQRAIEDMKKDFSEKHTVYADEIVKHIIE